MPQVQYPYEREVADLFRNSGWKVSTRPQGPEGADLLIRKGELNYVVEVKRASESRRDRVVPLLAEAILQSQAYARNFPSTRALAVVISSRFSRTVVEQALEFASLYAKNVAIGLLDDHGFRVFRGDAGLELLSSPFPDYKQRFLFSDFPSHSIFSDLGQWMLKVILARDLDPKLLRAPREPIHNASELATAAAVSPVSASRFLRQLEADSFLDRNSDELRVARVPDLLEEWEAVSRRCYKEIPARWILPHQSDRRLQARLRSYTASHGSGAESATVRDSRQLRMCLGLFAAAEALGVGLVHGVAPVIYVESLDEVVLDQLGISSQKPERADVYLRVPVFKESIFRAAVDRDGVPVSDVLQVWLDVSSHPSRGAEQANYLRQNILEPLLRG